MAIANGRDEMIWRAATLGCKPADGASLARRLLEFIFRQNSGRRPFGLFAMLLEVVRFSLQLAVREPSQEIAFEQPRLSMIDLRPGETARWSVLP
ncbi:MULTISPECIES: hypothetical protein [unclassified Mesorhizobium]|nr:MULTISPECIES: hypothetical protein [unclassified Mesorhizobium]TPI50684.1 hypothetical protein FJW11_23775 [Mesorhizobium sp. B3-1-1]TPJ64955.1 hypothetical protein FJ462_21350 [Mesorhizobium sp. B2-6-7]TPJ80856.1 hypothetical protein FJ422_22580 [Mesorhizobium sp. B2-6-3]TPK02142.1 hypothetical protein FJ491_10500 [Mesorhizobium sp. B2-5-10]TPK05399.1 hypothetical protein FJ490_27830 [Mesorhizobium sp. B2-5-11]